MTALHTSQLKSLPLVQRGKVRDIYAVGNDRLLIVQSDRISAFDVVMNEAVPDKGAVLTDMSNFWFSRFGGDFTNHLTGDNPADAVTDSDDRAQITGRAMLVKKLQPLPVEAVCRGYLIGSGWKDYQRTQSVCGITLPAGLRLAEKLPEVIFTPATKAVQGEHDENISYDEMVNIVGADVAEKVRTATLRLYSAAADYARERGIIVADTKFEFAMDDGELVLIDEVLTPDSSRFWRADDWRAGENPASYDKQYMRDWLETTTWNKEAPPPQIPENVINDTSAKYREIRERLLG